MLKLAKLAAAIALIAGGLMMQSVEASAMPALDVQPAQVAQAEGSSGVEQAYFYRRGFYGHRRFGFRRYGYGFGFHRYGYGFGYRRPFFRRRFYF